MKIDRVIRFSFVTVFFFASTLNSSTSAATEEDYSGRKSMSGYELKPYAGFEKNWHLVTVRYRKDTGEMRYTYANELAWKALQKGSTDYPKGSVFAKIGLATKEDPAFPSSAVPSGTRRYQLMVRDKSKHADTDGWGYALFDDKGLTFPGEPKLAAQACAACHRIVPERGFVFSQIQELAPFKPSADQGKLSQSMLEKSRLRFETLAVNKLSPVIRGRLPSTIKEVRILRGELEKHIFQGTLDEIRPALAKEILTTSAMNRAAILMSENGDMFSIVFPTQAPINECVGNQRSLTGIHSLDRKNERVFTVEFCQ